MHRKFEGNAAGREDSVADALGELDMVAIAGRKVGAGLGDADDGLARAQLRRGEAEIEIALDVQRRHAGIVGIVEPERGAQLAFSALGSVRPLRRSALVLHIIGPQWRFPHCEARGVTSL
jgi:hypothetical protein